MGQKLLPLQQKMCTSGFWISVGDSHMIADNIVYLFLQADAAMCKALDSEIKKAYCVQPLGSYQNDVTWLFELIVSL